MSKTFENLRQTYPVFTYHSYHWEKDKNDLILSFDFQIDKYIHFQPKVRICNHPAYEKFWTEQNLNCIENFVFHIGMIELISYWKCCCCPEIRIECAYLDTTAIQWWKKLYYHGLGEFFYINHIKTNMQDFVQIRCSSNHRMSKVHLPLQEAHIVPIGGGKDSVVTLETLKNESIPPLPLIINPRGATIESVKVSGLKEGFLEIHRPIDQRLLELNAEGYLNGHTPFSAMLAFYCILIAALAGRKYIALSNESSANEPTVQGSDINHQYSKSIEFESDFRSYVHTYIQTDISYYSFLRPLSELQIAMLFAQRPAYFPIFKSCNVGSKNNTWCGHCAKCLFAFIILSPFIQPETLKSIFGKNLLEDENLIPTLKELCGETEVKPFECVGTRDEVCLALCHSIPQYHTLPALLTYFIHNPLYEKYRNCDFNAAIHNWNHRHFLPQTDKKLLSLRITPLDLQDEHLSTPLTQK